MEAQPSSDLSSRQMFGAAVRIQIAWKGRLLLVRAREKRAADIEEKLAEEKRLFDTMMAKRRRITGRPCRPPRADEKQQHVNRSADNGWTAAALATAPPPHGPSRYAAQDVGSPLSQPVTPPTSPALPASARPKRGSQGAPQPDQSPQQTSLGTVRSLNDVGYPAPSSVGRASKPPLSVDGAANVIKFFIAARRMLRRQREMRNKEREEFLRWESSTFDALVPSRVASLAKLKSSVKSSSSATAPTHASNAVGDAVGDASVRPRSESKEMTLHEVAAAVAVATASPQDAARHQYGVPDTGNEGAAIACPYEQVVQPQPPPSSAAVPRSSPDDANGAVTRAAMRAELEDDEECCRFECATRYAAKTSILVRSFFEVARSLLATDEVQRRGAVIKAERTAFVVLEDVGRMSQDWMHSRVRCVVVLQCWARTMQARRTRSMRLRRRDQMELRRIAEEQFSERDAQDLNASLHLNLMMRVVAATTAQRMVRGHLARVVFARLQQQMNAENRRREDSERAQDDAAVMIGRFARRCLALRSVWLRQQLLDRTLWHNDQCDASLELLRTVGGEGLQRQLLINDACMSWTHNVQQLRDMMDRITAERAALHDRNAPAPPATERPSPAPQRVEGHTEHVRPLQPLRPESARVLHSARPPVLRRPTTATSSSSSCNYKKKKHAALSGADTGMLPYTDGSHDSNAALRAITSTPLFAATMDGPTNHAARLQDSGVPVDGERYRVEPVSPTAGDMITDLDDVDSQDDDGVDQKLTGSPTHNDDELLNYVGMLEVFKNSVLSANVVSPRHGNSSSRTPNAAAAGGDVGILYRDLVDVCLWRRGGVAESLPPPAAVSITITHSNSSSTGVDAPMMSSPTCSMRHAPHGLAKLWLSDKFVDRVVQRLGVLVLPQDIAHHVFCLDEVAVAVLSSIDVLRWSDRAESDGKGRLDPALRLHRGQAVAPRAEFESFSHAFIEALRQLSDERRAVDAATIAACFSLLDVHRRRLVPRTLFDAVFPLRLPSPPVSGNDLRASTRLPQTPQDVSFLVFASLLRRNLIHSPLTCQKHMGTFLQRVAHQSMDNARPPRQDQVGDAVAAKKANRLAAVQRMERQLRGLAVELLETLESVGERAGVSLGDALVLYTSLMAPPAARTVQWFCLSLVATFYNSMHLKAMGCFVGLDNILAKLRDDGLTAGGSAPFSPGWADVLHMAASLLESPSFVEALRLQRFCDGTAARSNPYRVPVSDTEEMDRCVPWSAFELPCLDSLNYYASQRVTFDADLDLKIKTDPRGFLFVESGGVVYSQEPSPAGATTTRRLITDLGVDLTRSASTHHEGFGLRRRQLNDLFYTLRHYALCLCDIAELQCMAQSHGMAGGTPASMVPKRARTMMEAEQQLLQYLNVHPDLLPTFPFRVGTGRDDGGDKHPKLFTSRFSRMLFTLSVIDPLPVDVPPPPPLSPPMCAMSLRLGSPMRGVSADGAGHGEAHGDCSPLCERIDHRVQSTAASLIRAAATGSPMVASRPSSASSISSNSSKRPIPTDLCSPPSRAMPAKPLSSVLFAEPTAMGAQQSSARPLHLHREFAAHADQQEQPRTVGEDLAGKKKSVNMESIMSSFRGFLRLDVPSTNPAYSTPSTTTASHASTTRPASATVKPAPPPQSVAASSTGNGRGSGVYATFRSGGLLNQRFSASGGNVQQGTASARRPSSAR